MILSNDGTIENVERAESFKNSGIKESCQLILKK